MSDDTVAPNGYKSSRTRADWASAMLIIVILITTARAYFTYEEIGLLERILLGEQVSEDETNPSYQRIALIGGFWVVAQIVAAVFFFFWLHRAFKNLVHLEVAGTWFSPGSGIGWWFVPLANLVIPYHAMKQLWKTSDVITILRNSTLEKNIWKEANTSPLLIVWWLLWLVCWFLYSWVDAPLSNIDLSEPASVDAFNSAIESAIRTNWLSILGDTLTVVSAILAIIIIRTIATRQDAKYSMIARIKVISVGSSRRSLDLAIARFRRALR